MRRTRRIGDFVIAWVALGCLVLGCDARELPDAAPTFDERVGALLEERCGDCHGDELQEADFSVASYLETIGCVQPTGEVATLPSDASAPILRALSRDDHAGLLDDSQRRLLEAWVSAGAPARPEAFHAVGWVDPRSPDFHGRSLRAERWAPMFDLDRPDACGSCHTGAPTQLEGLLFGAAGATDCTSCHSEPEGTLGCGTCHGGDATGAPPRDVCFFPEDADAGGAHDAHLALGLTCTNCHGERTIDVREGSHGDGVVDFAFDEELAGPGAAFDPETGTCAVACHDRGGATPRPEWNDETLTLGCGDCHSSPPAEHYAGTCDSCHVEANADGTALTPGPFHLDGVVELGDGSGTCAACHGSDGAPWPDTNAHGAHRDPALTLPVDCATCHQVPVDALDPGHFDETVGAEVTLSGLAAARGTSPTFDGTGCDEVACHGVGLGGLELPRVEWGDTSGDPSRCGSCHGAPPPAPHTADPGCASLLCHGGEVSLTPEGPGISEAGRGLHVDGVIDLARSTP